MKSKHLLVCLGAASAFVPLLALAQVKNKAIGRESSPHKMPAPKDKGTQGGGAPKDHVVVITRPPDLDTALRLDAPQHGLGSETSVELKVFNPLPGRLAFTADSKKEPYPTFLTLCALGQNLHIGKTGQGDANPVTTYPAHKFGEQILYSPLSSPDRRYILFKFGAPWASPAGYELHVFDTQTGSLKKLPTRASYEFVSWSPDSNYVAFVQGGDAQGNTNVMNSYIGPLKLYVCNWRTGETHQIAASDTLRGPFHWIAPHTLIYGMLNPETEKAIYRVYNERILQAENHVRPKKSQALAEANILSTRPSVYGFNPQEPNSKLLFKDGYRPVPSGNGQWIAFFGSENPKKPNPLSEVWEDAPQGVALCVARQDGTQRKALNREGGYYPFVRWLPDNKHLLTIQQVQESPDGQAQIKEWDIETGKWRQVALLQAKDYKPIPVPDTEPQFQPLDLSQDGLSLFVLVSEFIGRRADNFAIVLWSLQSVNLKTGSVTTIAQVKNVSGVDWCEDAAPPTSHLSASTASAPSN